MISQADVILAIVNTTCAFRRCLTSMTDQFVSPITFPQTQARSHVFELRSQPQRDGAPVGRAVRWCRYSRETQNAPLTRSVQALWHNGFDPA